MKITNVFFDLSNDGDLFRYISCSPSPGFTHLMIRHICDTINGVMTIRKQTFLVITVMFSILVASLILVARYVFLDSLKQVEDNLMKQNVERVENVFSHTVSGLESTTSDWASWDDTYKFVTDVDDDYIENNLVDDTFNTLSLNFMLFYDTAGNLVMSKAYDLENEEMVPVPSEVKESLAENKQLISRTETNGGTGGLLLIPGSPPLLFAAEPILTSKDEGPSRGTLLFGRYFDAEETGRLGDLAFLPVTAYTMNEADLPADVQDVYLALLNDEPVQTRILDGSHIAGYTLLYDVSGNPGVLIEVDQPRDIYMEGQQGIMYLVITLVAAGLVLGLFAMYIANKQGLSRLVKLSRMTEKIGVTGDLSERIPFNGNDEISRVSASINHMLEALQHNMEAESSLRKNLETEIRNRIDFTRALVHELKTPLTPMLTSSDLLVSELDSEPLHSIARNINRGAERLNRRINEMLDLARAEIGTLKLSFHLMDIISLVRDVISEIEPRINNLGLSMTVDMPESLPKINGDDDRLRQVLLNLLDNACKFTPEGGSIYIRVKENEGLVTVEIQDTGPGIVNEEQEKIFDLYYKIFNNDQNLRGLGLGLALCKLLVELHGGKIWVRNREEGGSAFCFTIPVYSGVSETVS